MKFSVLSELHENGLSVSKSNTLDIDTDRIDETLQVTVFRTPEGRPVQVLFGGDRLLSSSQVRKQLGIDNLQLDIRFFPRSQYPYGKFIRQAPLSERQGVLTIIDEDITKKDKVHVVSEPGVSGYFIDTKDLMKVFIDARVLSVTEPVITNTVAVSPSFIGHQNEENSRAVIEGLLGDPKTYLPVYILPATEDEIVTLSSIKNVRAEEVADVIESDPIFFFHFIQRVFDIHRQEDLDHLAKLSVLELIDKFGTSYSLSIATGIASESNMIQLDVSGVEVIPQYFRFTQICSEVSCDVAKKIDSEDFRVHPTLIKNMIKAYRGVIGIMIGMTEPTKIKEWIEITNANPHRYSMDTQYNVLGFTLMDVAKYLISELRFPSSYKVFFANFGSPFYQGHFSNYVILNYIISSFVSDNEDIDSALFKHLFKLHKHLAVKLGIMDEIEKSLSQIPSISERQEMLKWRFEVVPKLESKEFLNISKVDRNYFVFRN